MVDVNVAANVNAVRDRIVAAGGDLDRIAIVAVTKALDSGAVAAAVDAGVVDIGENYAQELVAKAALFSIRDDVQGETTSASLQKELGQVLKPIPVGPDILDSLNQKKRLDFLKKWQQAIGTK